ncbi:LVIVD repeat-containing protein [Egicoccus halophilus]|uniref:LVIVD repeat-containing protein n=1 Tax=Egicoccus halophilus TaxID=1670830 RepID=UPI0013EE5259|nr:hypothetical protein [Egicoccus halophilus]
MVASLLPAAALADVPGSGEPITDDPRVGLDAGFLDAEETSLGMDLVGQFQKPDGGLFDPNNVGSFSWANSDLTFFDHYAVQGNFAGFQIFDLSDPSSPALVTEVLCPGGQGDPSVHGDLLFFSVEQTRARYDCGTQGTSGNNDPDMFVGVRIFDISDVRNPEQVATVRTCRGSHTHRVVEDVNDPSTVYVYNSGYNSPMQTRIGCVDTGPSAEPIFESGRYQIEVIEVPLDAPEQAEVVNEARLFMDEETGALNGLLNEPNMHPSGTQRNRNTNGCHDITAYPELGLAAGACMGNGLLIDISDPANPERITYVQDDNFSFWHSANFKNDGSAVMFTDEWGGGSGARCRATDRLEWGANAIYDIVDTPQGKRLEFASYYKMPAVQTGTENCVAHQANIVPVPGRDIMMQAWYQGGLSMFDWTDTANPREIGYFDRGPIFENQLTLGGYWSGYWYNGQVYGSEIARGFDVFDLTPTDELTANEIAAANEVVYDQHMPMMQTTVSWRPSFNVTRAYNDQALRSGALDRSTWERVDRFVDRAEQFSSGPQRRAAVSTLTALAGQLERTEGAEQVAKSLRELLATLG